MDWDAEWSTVRVLSAEVALFFSQYRPPDLGPEPEVEPQDHPDQEHRNYSLHAVNTVGGAAVGVSHPPTQISEEKAARDGAIECPEAEATQR